MVCSGVLSHIFKVCSGSLGTLYGRKNSLLARRKLDRFPYLQYSTTTISGPGGADDLMVEAQHIWAAAQQRSPSLTVRFGAGPQQVHHVQVITDVDQYLQLRHQGLVLAGRGAVWNTRDEWKPPQRSRFSELHRGHENSSHPSASSRPQCPSCCPCRWRRSMLPSPFRRRRDLRPSLCREEKQKKDGYISVRFAWKHLHTWAFNASAWRRRTRKFSRGCWEVNTCFFSFQKPCWE